MSHQVKSITEQVIFITGASSGIGLATATLAAQRGAKVVLVSRNLKELQRLCKELNQAGGTAICAKADVSNMKQLQAARDKAISTFGRIDTWVNNAGASIYGKLTDLDIKEEKRLFDVNFWGVRNGCHLAVESMSKAGGVIINLGSEVSDRATPLLGIYSATKQAVKAYTDALRIELADDKLPLHVCLIRPTAINTPFSDHAANRLRSGTPVLPNPVYDPLVVAEAILTCAVAPQRDVFVGGPSKMMSVLESLSPMLTDKYQESSFKSQVSQRRGHPSEESLFTAPKHEGNIHGSHPENKERKSSLYTSITTHPMTTLVASAGLSIAVSALKSKLFKK